MRRVRRGGLSLIVLVLLASAAAGEADWQTSAKGLTDGPLCSLVLQVRLGEAAELCMPGGSLNTGWGTIGPHEIPLGCIAPPKAGGIVKVERSGDFSGGRATVSFAGGETITLYASQLSPGIAIETSGHGLRLFAGQHDRTVTFDGGKMQIRGHIAGKPLPRTAITPARLAVLHGREMKVFDTRRPVGLPRKDEAWVLVWWSKASHFVRSALPLGGRGLEPAAAGQADCPLLLVFDQPPTSIAAAKEGGLDFVFAQAKRRVVILPVMGASPAAAGRSQTTQAWDNAFPDALAATCRTLASFARQYPLRARQGFRYDAAKDEATFTETSRFLAVGPGGRKLAPLPPAAAVAMQAGLKIAPSAALHDLGVATAFGPVLGAPDAETLSWSVGGLGRYVAARRAVEGKGKAPADLEAELRVQVGKLLAPGKPLAPWAYADNIPINRSRGEYYWGEPGEALALLCEIRAALDPDQRSRLAAYMAALCEAHPPQTRALIPPDKGARRGGYDVGPCPLTKRIAAERGGRVSLFALYGLERHYAALGKKLPADAWPACRKIVGGALDEQAWGTLYLLGHPNRLLPWQKRQLKPARLREHLASPHWRGDRPAAVVNANRQFAGAIGAVRLARLAGDDAAEQQAWWLLARAAVVRYAMGKYAAWQYGAGLAELPADKEWFWKWRARFPQSWGGDLETTDWSKPTRDVRQVVEFAPDRVALAHWAGVVGDAWTQRCTAQLVAFRYMTPELALFLRERLPGECRALVRRIEWNHPVWYASFAEAILGWEHNMNHPSDAYQVFCAHAQILGASGRQLARWIDVPWLDRGDLFYLHKLAETVKAYRGVRWRGESGKQAGMDADERRQEK